MPPISTNILLNAGLNCGLPPPATGGSRSSIKMLLIKSKEVLKSRDAVNYHLSFKFDTATKTLDFASRSKLSPPEMR